MKAKLFFLLPLALFLFICVFLLKGLFSDPRERDSTIVGKPIPDFILTDVMDLNTTYTQDDLKGKVRLVNVWGTWCITCNIEIPYLTQLRESGVEIVGLYYEQDIDPDFGVKSRAQIQQEIAEMLTRLGNPYQYNIFDEKRETSLDLGVTGAPETFLVDKQGIVRLHHIGDLNERVWMGKFAMLYQELAGEQ